jgi:hypothetical protein
MSTAPQNWYPDSSDLNDHRCYLTAFENNALDPMLLRDRLTELQGKTGQLQARRDELTELLDHAPAMPSNGELDALADHIDQILDRGTPAPRTALVEQLVEEIQLVAPGRIRPIYRIPRRTENPEPTTDDCTTVRTMGNLVGLTCRHASQTFAAPGWQDGDHSDARGKKTCRTHSQQPLPRHTASWSTSSD